MKEIIVYTPAERESELHSLMAATNWRWVVVHSTEALLEAVETSVADAVVTYGLAINQLEDLLTLLNLHEFQFLPIFTVIDEREKLNAALALPVGGATCIPVSRTELRFRLERMIQDLDINRTVMEGMNWQGNLVEFNLIDLLQMVEGTGKDGVIELRYLDWVATVYFHQGKPIQAKFGTLEGFPAILKMGGWNRGTFQVKFTAIPSIVDEIGMSTQEILVQLMSKISEQESLRQQLPAYTEELMSDPFAEVTQLTPVQQRIVEMLRHPRPLFQLLLMLPEDDRDILKELLVLWEEGIVGLRSDVERHIQEQEEKKGMGRIFSTVARWFRRKEAPEEPMPEYRYEEEPQEIRVEVELPALTDKDFEAIREKLG